MWEGGGWGGGLFKAGYLFNFSFLSEPTGLALILGWAQGPEEFRVNK